MNRNDILWKAALEDLFDDFLKFFYPNAAQIFDLNKGFEYLDKELDQLFPPEQNQYAPRHVDKLVKVFTQNGAEEWILIHVEVQGYTDQNFAKRMFQYYYRILDKYDKPVTAFAIFADNNKNFHPQFYEREYLGTKVHYSYNTYKILDQDDAALEASNNPFAMAVLSAKLVLSNKKLEDQQLFDLAYALAKRLLNKQMPKDKIRRVMNFLRYYLHFENQEMFTKFEQEISVLTNKNITMGIEEFLLDRAEKEGIEKGIKKGKQEGIEKGKQEEALTIAREMKKENFPVEQIARFTKISVEEIEKLRTDQ